MALFAKERNLTPSLALFNPSMSLLRHNFWHVLYLSFLPRLLFAAGLAALVDGSKLASGERLATGLIISGIGLVWYLSTVTAFIYFQTQVTQHKYPTIMEALRASLPRIPAYLMTAGLSFLLIVFGLLLFIIPGLILLRGFFLAPYYAVDEKMGPIQALGRSLAVTKPVSGWIWGVIGIQMLIAIGALTFQDIPGIGPVVTMAISYLYIFAPVLRYAEIEKDIPAIKQT